MLASLRKYVDFTIFPENSEETPNISIIVPLAISDKYDI